MSLRDLRIENIAAMIAIFEIGFGEKKMLLNIVRKLFKRESIPSIPKWVKDLLLKTTNE